MKNNFYKKLSSYGNIFVSVFSSMKLAVVLLSFLFVLTLVGTLYQTSYGLYAAQQRYFYSWFFLIGGFIPFPGALTLLLLFSVNLLVSAYKRYRFKVSKLGIIAIHYGIIFLLAGSLYSFYKAEESFVSLLEGEETNYSENYYQSELVIWKEQPINNSSNISKKFQSYNLQYVNYQEDIVFSQFSVRIKPLSYFPHAEPATFFEEGIESVTGAKALNFKPTPLKQEQAMPGIIFLLQAPFLSAEKKVLLWEGDGAPFALKNPSTGETYYLMLQRKRSVLPFTIRLKKFVRKTYYGSEIPKEFSSEVEIVKNGGVIPAKIYMNNPLRLQGYTFFQASFAIEASGNKRSIFATVKNAGYYVPYISSLIITLGLVYHFFAMGITRRKNRRKK